MPTSHNDAIRSPRMRKSSYTLLYYIGAVLLFLSCDSRTTYSHYQHVNVTGWEKRTMLSSMRFLLLHRMGSIRRLSAYVSHAPSRSWDYP